MKTNENSDVSLNEIMSLLKEIEKSKDILDGSYITFYSDGSGAFYMYNTTTNEEELFKWKNIAECERSLLTFRDLLK